MPGEPGIERPNYGGKALETIRAIKPADVQAFRSLGFNDAEQVLATLATSNAAENLKQAFGMSQEYLDTVVAELRSVVPIPMMASDTAALHLGALAPTPQIAATTASMIVPQPQMAQALPSSVNRAPEMPQCRSQGSRGTCVSFAMTAVHEYYTRASTGTVIDYSEQFLYHETKRIDDVPAVCGTYVVKAAQILGSLGQCTEATWTYNGDPPCNNNGVEPAGARPEALSRKLPPVVLNTRDTTAIKTAIATGSVVAFSIPVYNSWYQSSETARTGRITMRIGNEPANGGHAMCLIGYQDDQQAPGGGYFTLRNSWFGVWGTQCPFGSGNGTIPYAYIANESWEAATAPATAAIA